MHQIEIVKTLATIGGKIRLLKLLIPIMRDCVNDDGLIGFIDVFGGGNKFIPHLDLHMEETIYNDSDRGFCNVMACCTDIYLLQEMIDIAYQYQYYVQTKEEFESACKRRVDPSTPMVESAALTIIVQAFSRAADRRAFSKANAMMGISYKSLLKFKELYPSMSKTRVLCTDYKNVLEVYKRRPDFLLYIDPPYFGTTSYDGEVNHKELAQLIVNSRAPILISNFDNLDYENILVRNGWRKYCLGEITKSSSGKKGITQLEFLWSNIDISNYLLPQILLD
ncbi:DNA adenine methylase [Lysinibacillus capsici]|uniref:DNA adenine methylase n=1 Tax=Lysinibacillus capsici TaxID=2115968 RepID=UPI002DBAC303|nr:DNA adenine methylase [Lysinibacillus capsici]MEC1304293.1 DNA adenine methylase [Lysinibacillus capsici]